MGILTAIFPIVNFNSQNSSCIRHAKHWRGGDSKYRDRNDSVLPYAPIPASKLPADAGAHPETAAARVKAIAEWMRVEKTAEAVRERIAAEKADGGAGSGKK